MFYFHYFWRQIETDIAVIYVRECSAYLSPRSFTVSGLTHKKNLQTVNSGDGVERMEPSYRIGGNVNWYSHYGEQFGGSLKN